MKFICEKYELQKAVNTCAKSVPGKTSIISLTGLLITAGTDIRITGFDLKEAIYTDIDADIIETGSIIVDCRLFTDMMRLLPDGKVTMTVTDNNVNVKCGKGDFNFIGLSAETYPDLPGVEALKNISLPQGILRSMIEETIFATATDEIRPIYTGVLFEINEDVLTMVAVDGFRLAKRVEKLEKAKMENCSFVVPGSTLADVKNICENPDEDVEIALDERHILFKVDKTVIISRRLEGEFMNYNKAIPSTFKYNIKVEREELLKTIDRVGVIISQANISPIRMSFTDGRIECRCVTPVGKAEDMCICDGSGDDMIIGFNAKYMTDALKAMKDKTVMLGINTPSSPCVFTSVEESDKYLYMVLPVRLKN